MPRKNSNFESYWDQNGDNVFVSDSIKCNPDDEYVPTVNDLDSWKRSKINSEEERAVVGEIEDNLFVVTTCETSYTDINNVKIRLGKSGSNQNANIDFNGGGTSVFKSIKRNLNPRLEFLNDISIDNSRKLLTWDKTKEKTQRSGFVPIKPGVKIKTIDVPVIHVLGLDKNGRSVCVNVHGFYPYIYVPVPEEILNDYPDDELAVCEAFAESIEKWASNFKKYMDSEKDGSSQNPKSNTLTSNGKNSNYVKFVKNGPTPREYVVKIEIVQKIPGDGGHLNEIPMFKITFLSPSLISSFRNKMVKETYPGFDIKLNSSYGHQVTYKISGLTYDSCILFENRFFIDTDLHGGCWFRLRKGSPRQIRFNDRQKEYKEIYQEDSKHCISRAQIEIDVHVNDIIALDQYDKSNGDLYAKPIEKLRVMSFDIECIGYKRRFPTGTSDPIICIHAYCTTDSRLPGSFLDPKNLKKAEESPIDGGQTSNATSQADLGAHNVVSINFSCGTSEYRKGDKAKQILRGYGCKEPVIYSFSNERKMLNGFFAFLCGFDADIITGYNTSHFDIPYVVERCKTLGIPKVLNCSKLLSKSISYEQKTKDHKKNGNVAFKKVECCGRLCWDVLPFVRECKRFPSYSLNYVSLALFGEQKDDINHITIPVFYRKSARHRDIIRIYCEKDSYLALRLFLGLQIFPQRLEASRVSGIRLEQEEGDSTSGKGFPFITRSANKRGFVIPYIKPEDNEKQGYIGAIVQDPIIGFYNCLIAVLDYLSEYPNQIIANNICFTTYIPPEKLQEMIEKYGPDCYSKAPFVGHCFLKKHIREGILPQAEKYLLDTRAKVKMVMEKLTEGSTEHSVLDCRQNQLKIKANGPYCLLSVFP